MMKRRLYKRPWQKFHEVQESFWEITHLRPLKNKDTKREKMSGASDRHSPESVLYESDPCLCSSKLSPEIILKQSEMRLQSDISKDAIEDVIVERANSSQEFQESSNLLMCNFNIEPRDDFANSKNYYPKHDTTIIDDLADLTDSIYSCSSSSLNNVLNSDANRAEDVTHDGQSLADAFDETTRQKVSHSTFPSNLKSQSHDDSITKSTNSYEKHERQSLKEDTNRQKNCDISGTMENCYTLDKTFSMNDDLMRETNNYLEGQSLKMIADQSTMETTCKLKKDYISESAHFAVFHESEKQSSEGLTDNVGRLSADELAGLSICKSIEDHDGSENDKRRRKETPGNDNKRFDAVLEKIGDRLTANWSEMFAYLQRVSKKICGEDSEHSTSLLYKMLPYISISTSSSSFSTLSTSPDNRGRSKNRDVTTRFSFSGQRRNEFAKDEEKTERIESKIQPETNSCGESPSVEHFRDAILTFDYEGEAKKQRQSEIRAEIADLFPEKNEESSLVNPLLRGKTHWDNILESTLDLSMVLNYDGRSNSLNKEQQYHQDDTCKREMPQNDSTLQDTHVSRRRNICCTLINTWSYKKLREIFIPSSSTETSQTKKFNHLIATLRSENEKMLRLLSQKITRLSMDFVQVQTSTEATLKALTIELNIIRETSRKMTEDNMTLMQELKKLRETLEEVGSRFSQPVPSFPSCPSSFSPSHSPPPPPPPPPSPVILPPPSSVSLLPKVHILESIPPPPPLPLASLQSPKPRIQSPITSLPSSKPPIQPPTTPNSSRSNKKTLRTPRRSSTPLFNRPSITVEDLLKVTLKKAPQSIKDSRRNTVPGPRGPVVSLEMLRNVKLKSAKRRTSETGKSPRSGRIVKNRTASSVNLSPILTGSEGNLERILRQVNLTRPRRLVSGSNSFRDRDFAKEMQSQSLQTLMHSQSQSALE